MDKKIMLESLINHFTDGNKAAFAKILGITPQTLSGWLNRNSMDNELIFSKLKVVSPYWLLTGEGEMLSDKDAETPAPHTQAAANQDPAALLAAKEETIAALRQALADKERLISTLLAAQEK